MHNGSRAICFLMALAATGAETASASFAHVIAEPVALQQAQSGGDVGSIDPVRDSSQEINVGPQASHTTAPLPTSMGVSPQPKLNWSHGDVAFRACTNLLVYDSDGRRSASIADANARELLFVKISRG